MSTPASVRARRALPPQRRRGAFFTRTRPAPPRATTLAPRADETASDAVLAGEADGERGFALAMRLAGERALPVDRGMVMLSPQRLCRHLLVCGATGSGKTETLLRLAWAIARESDAPVFYLDGKGDRETAARFSGLMADAGRATRVFPNEPFDAWRGEAHEIHGRLMEIIDYTSDGPAAWYRDVAKNVLRLVCEHPDGPPRTSAQALARMDADTLAKAHQGSSALAALTAQQVKQVRLRYEAFFGQTRGALDGEWAWEDTSAAYLLLDSLALREETAGLARMLFEDFAHYFTSRKPRNQFAVLIVDEFSGLAQGAGMAARIEQARGFNTSLVLAPQVVAGMGDESEAARILGSVESVICHRVNTPEEICALAGTRQRMEYSSHYASEGATGEGSARIQHQFKVDPNKVRALPPGAAYVISRGRAMKVQMLQAPQVRGLLPEPVDCKGGHVVVPVDMSRSEEVQRLPF
jgi:conjugal transfer pilus assembly protein TraD